MADQKLSELTLATGAVSSDLLYVVQGATSKKIAFSSVLSSISALINISAYATKTFVTGELTSYTTNASLTSTLNSYTTNVNLTSTLASYTTNANLTSSLASTTSITLNILKIDDGVHEKFQALADATGTVTHNCSAGHIFYHTSPDANWTANFTNLSLSSTYATTVTLVIAQGATGYIPNAVQIAGSAQTINWQGNVTPTPTTSRTDVVTFSILNNAGTYTVLGQLTGF